ncbi:uncharacterized protein M437DRAFT_58321 [Aureobasidium melanogenum CBS 110374]|uniref:Aminoglycoside phosphotransferase domain-containing protein n=1 Tax=Aureobasidium melanogenum (strain CBS 110374) TaxID=1043003 RepID=A0A074VEH6_AURM1|nr:uncharacterized protein M437DRAFT_58321 [Aureobasidium melanogenum CBS 110374]KEQ58823.1 hypothetical protein M437DRAFT_58321 [Aureobasidium melanogenum CBS 110374]
MDRITSLEAIILPQARLLRPGTGPVTLSPGNSSQEGCSHNIFIVTLADSSHIIARVAKSHNFDSLERNGVDMLNHITSLRPELKVPKVLWHNLDSKQEQTPREFTIVLQDLIPGKPLGSWNELIPQSQQMCFLDSLARFLVELWSIPTSGTIETEVPALLYSQWLENMIDKAIRRCITGDSRWGTTRDYLVMRSLISYYASPHDHITEYGIAHGDMHALNIMVDERLELSGVVDWDWTFTAPLPAIVQFPWFLADVPGWHNEGTKPGETFHHSRDYLVQALRAAEMSANKSDRLTNLLASARERQIFQSAINCRDVHKAFVEEDRRFRGARGKDVRGELEAFLVIYPDLRDEDEVKLIMGSMQ